MADSQNYGDDVPAQDLINPPAFSDLSIAHDAMNELKNKSKIVLCFQKIGYNLDSDIFDIVFNVASKNFPTGFSTINAFRNVLNDYLDALESGEESAWLLKYSRY